MSTQHHPITNCLGSTKIEMILCNVPVARRYAEICGYRDLIDECPESVETYLAEKPILNSCEFSPARGTGLGTAAADAPASEETDMSGM